MSVSRVTSDGVVLPPPSPVVRISEGSLARFVYDLVGEFDRDGLLEDFYPHKKLSAWGRAAHNPRIMIQLLFYAYCSGVLSSRSIQRAVEDNLTYRFLAENERPDFRVIANFRRDKLEGLNNLFGEFLRLSRELGLSRLANVVLESKDQASIGRQVRSLFEEAERLDRFEDARFGKEIREQELPADLQTVEDRLRRFQQVRAKNKENKTIAEKVIQVADEQIVSEEQLPPGDFAGSLLNTPFPEILGRLYHQKASGAIVCTKGYRRKSVYLKNGYPVFVESNLVSECLGTLLVRSRVITQSQCDTSLRKMMASGKPQGEVLIEMGCISPRNLDRVLELQLQRKLFNLFSWEDGDYRFRAGVAPPESRVKLNITTANAIHKGIQSQFKAQRATWELNRHMESLVVPSDHPRLRFQKMDLTAEEEQLAAGLGGNQTLRMMRDQAKDREQFYKLVYALKCAGMISFKPVLERTEEPPATGERERLAQKIQELKGQNHHQQLGVGEEESLSRVEKVYDLHVKQYGPGHERQNDTTQVRLLRSEIFKTLNTAYNAVIGGKKRKPEPKTRPKEPAQPEASGPALVLTEQTRAEELTKRGRAAMQTRDYAWAKVLFQQAIKLCPQQGQYRAELGRAVFLADPDKTAVVREARDHINRAISMNPDLDIAHLYLGQIYRKMGHDLLADFEFKKAVEINPACTDALRELKNRKKAAQNGKEKRRGLGRLFG